MQQVKILLDESDIPENWYNVVADMPKAPAPSLGPDGKPIGPEALAVIFPGAIIEQEVSRERWIPIPEPVREIYRQWRPSPMYRALRLEQALGTPARIYYKYEGRQPRRLAQAQHFRRASLLQSPGRRSSPRHRDRRGSMGRGAGDGRADVRHRSPRLHGAREL
jgi:hypothetical protein